MGTRDPRVDAYIAGAADFAKPILTELREIVDAACSDCEEAMKWRSPTFMYKGMLCGMSAFKEHAVFGFWKGPLVVEEQKGENPYRVFDRLTKLWITEARREETRARRVQTAVAQMAEGKPHNWKYMK